MDTWSFFDVVCLESDYGILIRLLVYLCITYDDQMSTHVYVQYITAYLKMDLGAPLCINDIPISLQAIRLWAIQRVLLEDTIISTH